jgi:hypothetical protein
VTFLDIHYFFTNRTRQKNILDQLKSTDRELWERWKEHFPTPNEYTPIVSRMNDFVRNPSLKAIFDCPNPQLKISTIMNDKRILLVNLTPITQSKKIFGALLVSKFQQAAFRRAILHKDQIIPFHLYVDEFEYFQTSSFAEIFSVAGGLGLPLTIRHQFSEQLDAPIRSAVTGNAGNYIIFQLGHNDLPLYRHIVQPYDVRHLTAPTLQPYQACFKIQGQPPIWKWVPPPPRNGPAVQNRLLGRYPFNRLPPRADSSSAMQRTITSNTSAGL